MSVTRGMWVTHPDGSMTWSTRGMWVTHPDGSMTWSTSAPVNETYTTEDYRRAIATDKNDPSLEMFTPAYDWHDKPHRVVWDLCTAIESLHAELQELRRLTNTRSE